jgi:geranylgeranyl diphosphate synthase, type II
MHLNSFDQRLVTDREEIDSSLRRLLVCPPHSGRTGQDFSDARASLLETIQYATLGPAKRIRPLLAFRVARLLKTEMEFVLKAALAVEIIHCASLIIDDLPCMDNAECRRGRPAVHIRFGESRAILAAFSMVALAADSVIPRKPVDASQLAHTVRFQHRLLQVLSCDALIGGQAWDLECKEYQRRKKAESLSSLKTAPLFELAAMAGCISSEGSDCQRVLEFARAFGVLFQLVNDLSDGNELPGAPVQSQLSRVYKLLEGFGAEADELIHMVEHLMKPLPDATQSNSVMPSRERSIFLSRGEGPREPEIQS